MENKTIIEINGVKLEVDLATAKRIDNLRVGDTVKVLIPEYGDTTKVCPGVIIGFENFKQKPTIVVAYLEIGYNEAKIKYLYYNADSKAEMVRSSVENIPFEKSTVVELMDGEILKAERNLLELKAKKEYFLNNFSRFFEVAIGH